MVTVIGTPKHVKFHLKKNPPAMLFGFVTIRCIKNIYDVDS